MISSDSIVIRMYRNSLKVNLVRLKVDSILGREKEIVQMNKNQIRHGFDSYDKYFVPYRDDDYAVMKSGLASYLSDYPIPDLYLTGRFQNQMYLDVIGKNVFIDSRDDKAPKLKAKYAPFGLDKANHSNAQTIVSNDYVKEVAKALRK